MAKPSAKASVDKKGRKMVKQPHGGALVPGAGGGDNGGGRPPDEFKAKMREMASADSVLKYLRECLDGDHGGKVAVSAHKHIAERGYGKVPNHHEVTGADGGPIQVTEVRHSYEEGE